MSNIYIYKRSNINTYSFDYERFPWNICNDMACQQGMLTYPDTWFPLFLGLEYILIIPQTCHDFLDFFHFDLRINHDHSFKKWLIKVIVIEVSVFMHKISFRFYNLLSMWL